jgi:ribosomal protein S18 acetylase RimI-like enzyme
MIEVKPANKIIEFKIIEDLAKQIWYQHYPDIISLEQIEYMLTKFNSAKAIEKAIKTGTEFYYLTFNGTPVGYTAIKTEADFLFLSKLYVLKDFRGKGIGKAALNFIDEEVKKHQLSAIRLKVNKYNTASIAAYEKLGFKKRKAMITDIGNGFIMDDFVLEKCF